MECKHCVDGWLYDFCDKCERKGWVDDPSDDGTHIENIHDAPRPTDAHKSTVAMLKISEGHSARLFEVFEDLNQIDALLSTQAEV